MNCPSTPAGTNSRGDTPYNEFYQVDEMRDLAYRIVNKYANHNSCPPFKFIVYWVHKHIKYVTDQNQFGVVDYWLFPEETLITGMEDCDGMSFLTASLLEAYGYPTRVCMGYSPFGYHAWVEFFDGNESYIVEATMGKIYHMADAKKLNYIPDIYITPNGCATPDSFSERTY